VATYTYDSLYRLTSKKFLQDPSQDIIYTYDSTKVSHGKGRLTGREDPSGIYTFHYDSNGNLTKEEKQIGNVTYTTKYGYNKNNTLTSVTYPSGRIITYIPDEIERISKVSTGAGFRAKPLASSISYLPFGGLTGFTYGNGLPLSHSHDYQYRISSIAVNSLLNRTYEHDPNGNVTSITDTVNPNWNQPQERPETYTYEQGTNRLSQVTGEAPITFGYDPNGNTKSENTRTFEYDYSNRLTMVKENDSTIAEYVYNGAGQRIIKKLPNETQIFHYDSWGHLIAETDENGQALAEYVYLGDQLLSMIRGGETYYYHNDHLGTPQILTDTMGKVVWKAGYNAFGETNILIEQVENPFRFPGQYYDMETGLHYNYFRDFNPRIGRYMTPDPIGLEGGINLFVYVSNNPVNWNDPWGLSEDATFWTWYGPDQPGLEANPLIDPVNVVAAFGASTICTLGKPAVTGALGFFPTKTGGGSYLQHFSRETGRWVNESKPLVNKIYMAVNRESTNFIAGVGFGFAEGRWGSPAQMAVTPAQKLGQFVGRIAGNIWGGF
jgi:RHS repeat-associated protein